MELLKQQEQRTDKELQERLKMALEAILQLESYHNIEVAKKIAKTALQGR